MKTIPTYDFPEIGCYVDTSAQSADDCNQRTIEFASYYGFDPGMPSGCFDGLRGLYIEMTLDDAESASHQGECIEDVLALVAKPEIAAQLDKIGSDAIRLAMKGSGGFSAEELADDDGNRNRAVWMAACDIRENASEWLSETADDALDYLNTLETRSFLSWQFEDNSLFLVPDIDGAKESCEESGFVSSKSQEYPSDDYRGEWLHVNDHGNVTLYVRGDNGQDTEVWSCV